MKKLIFRALACCISVIALCSFTIDKTLTNEQYGQKLLLYSDGTCVIVTPDGRGSGKYDIRGSKITINWDNGYTQQGSYSSEGSPNRTARVNIEGVNYDAARRVVARPRR